MKGTKEKLNSIEKYFCQEIRDKKFSRLLVTVSGGADSVALLAALSATKAQLTAAHCNFHLRGEESMRDQRHVEVVCSRLGVPLLVRDFDVDSYIASRRGVSVEMACRQLRYDWFDETASRIGAQRIVTGHNADDNIETLFLNLMRGSGTSGLRGMLPDTGHIWRPLLRFHRPEIEKYLAEKGIPFITDSSNLSSDYRRNFLRNEVIPLLRSRWSGFDKALDRSVTLLRNENRIVAAAVENALPPSGSTLAAETVTAFPDPELLVRRFIEPAGPYSTTAAEIIDAIRADKPDKKTWKLRSATVTLRAGKLTVSRDD